MRCDLLTEDIIPEYSVDSHIHRAEQLDTFTKMITFHPEISKVRWQNAKEEIFEILLYKVRCLCVCVIVSPSAMSPSTIFHLLLVSCNRQTEIGLT